MEARSESKPKPQHKPAYRRMVKRLLACRQQACLSQRALAVKLRLPPSTIHKIEHGDRRIDPIEFRNWCRACGVDPGKTLNDL